LSRQRAPDWQFHGALAPLSAVELGTAVVRSLLEKTAVAPEQIDEVILGRF
jgi:acetyl-CoA C-acetyltransferase